MRYYVKTNDEKDHDLHPYVTGNILFQKFSIFGPVHSVRVFVDPITRRSLGSAYVNFRHLSSAKRALDIAHTMAIRITRFPTNLVFIKNLDGKITTKVVHDIFSVYGNILNCTVAQDENGISKGHGFVYFETEEAAVRSSKKLNGMLLNDKKIDVVHFVLPKDREKELGKQTKISTTVFVRNFDEVVTEEQLRGLFEEIGPIDCLKIVTDEDGKSRGFGFVAFKTSKTAEAAVGQLNGKKIIGNKPLYVVRAQTKVEREQEIRKRKGLDEARLCKDTSITCAQVMAKVNLD
ncbi:hypothetical protein FQA39_LY00936 [Lamprigera yunnana]|nr:hypothetical protein FQA39_LY00936 [Lamprigera yunnana]